MQHTIGRYSDPIRRVMALVAGATLLVAALLLTFPSGARASTVGAIRSVTVGPSTLASYTDQITTDIAWCVPDGTTPGDTFSMTLPGQLTDYPTSFSLTASDGSVVATSAITGSPAVVTFTLSAYAATHEGICGTAYFTADMGYRTAGTTQTLTYVTSDGQRFAPTVTVAAATGIDRAVPHTWGSFTRSSDQCAITAKDCLTWVSETPVGPSSGGTVVDTASAVGSVWTFDCSTVTAYRGNATADNNAFNQGVPDRGVTVSCTPDRLEITYGAVDAGAMVQFTVKATAAVVNPQPDTVYRDAARFALIGTGGATATVTSGTSVTSAAAGGQASGTSPTAPTVAPVPGHAPSSSTGGELAAAGPKVGAGLALVVGGGTALLFGRRRRSGSRR